MLSNVALADPKAKLKEGSHHKLKQTTEQPTAQISDDVINISDNRPGGPITKPKPTPDPKPDCEEGTDPDCDTDSDEDPDKDTDKVKLDRQTDRLLPR